MGGGVPLRRKFRKNNYLIFEPFPKYPFIFNTFLNLPILYKIPIVPVSLYLLFTFLLFSPKIPNISYVRKFLSLWHTPSSLFYTNGFYVVHNSKWQFLKT